MIRKLVASVLLMLPCLAWGYDVRLVGAPAQGDFHAILEDLAAAYNYQAIEPAEATGITGVGVSAIMDYTSVHNKDAWRRATGQDVNNIGLVGVAASKGLPFNLDVGAFYSTVPNANVNLYGGEIRYALLPGGIAQPALAVRLSATKLTGVNGFRFSTYGADVSLSKGFTIFTPYVGIGEVWVHGNPDPRFGLSSESFSKPKTYIGMRLGLALLDFTAEISHTGSTTSFNGRVGFSF